jgi:hypothetical protein
MMEESHVYTPFNNQLMWACFFPININLSSILSILYYSTTSSPTISWEMWWCIHFSSFFFSFLSASLDLPIHYNFNHLRCLQLPLTPLALLPLAPKHHAPRLANYLSTFFLFKPVGHTLLAFLHCCQLSVDMMIGWWLEWYGSPLCTCTDINCVIHLALATARSNLSQM